jgi:ribose transport system permease protein
MSHAMKSESSTNAPSSFASVLARNAWLGPLAALVVVYVLFYALAPDTFARADNLVTMARQTAVVAVAAVGMTLVVVAGGIDLSVGSIVALGTVVVAKALLLGLSVPLAVLAAVVVAAGCGVLNGLAIAKLRITPFIVTLGAMSVVRGAAKGIAHEQKIDVDSRGLESLLAVVPKARAWQLLPPGVWLAIGVALLFAAVLRATRFGRHLVAIGSSEPTARLCGVRVDATKIAVYALAGALAGVASVLEFSTLTVGDPTDSIGLELTVIAAVVIGGGSLSGGEGSVLGTVLGALLMTVIRTGNTHLGLRSWVQEMVTGAIIVVAVALDRLRHRRA